MKDKKIRIVIADDHMLVRIGLRTLIAGERDMTCVGEAENGKEAIQLAKELKPDVIIMDLMMPIISGADATRLILKVLPETRIIILTSYGTTKEMSDAIANGACAALMKDGPTSEVIDAIRAVSSGKSLVPEYLLQTSAEVTAMPKLTEHQKKILSSICLGRSNADIAKEFGLAECTMKKLVSSILTKVGASNRSEATSIALRLHLVDV